MQSQSDTRDFFAKIYSSLKQLSQEELSEDMVSEFRSGKRLDETSWRENPHYHALLIASASQRGTLSNALESFFEVPPMKERLNEAISSISTRYPGLLDAPGLTALADSVVADDDDDVDEDLLDGESESGEYQDAEMEPTVGVASVSASPLVLMTGDAIGIPGIQLKVRDSRKSIVFDRLLPISDALFLTTALARGSTEALRVFALTVENPARWPPELAAEILKMVEELANVASHLASTALKMADQADESARTP